MHKGISSRKGSIFYAGAREAAKKEGSPLRGGGLKALWRNNGQLVEELFFAASLTFRYKSCKLSLVILRQTNLG